MTMFPLTTVDFPSINNSCDIIYLNADKPFPFVVWIWCVSFFPQCWNTGLYASFFVQLIIYLPFCEGLCPIFNISISEVLFTIFFFFPILVGYGRFLLNIVYAFAVKKFYYSSHCHESRELTKIPLPSAFTSFSAELSQVLCTYISFDLHEYCISSRFWEKEARQKAVFMALTEILTAFLIYYTFLIWLLLLLCQLNSNKVEIIIFLIPTFAQLYI